MAGLRDLWPYAGVAGGIITGGLAVYYGPQKILQTWEWYLDRWCDSKVRDILMANRKTQRIEGGRIATWGQPLSVADISKALGVPEKSVASRLGRLCKRGEAVQHGNDWKAPDKYE
jgi:hypothetical protein